MKLFKFVCLLVAFFSASAWSQEFLTLNSAGLPSQTVSRLQEFIRGVEGSLPRRVAQVLLRSIPVRFSDFGSSRLDLPTCDNTQKSLEENITHSPRHVLYGRSNRNFFSGQIDSIEINSAFIPEILRGSAQARTYKCGHQDLFRLAKATLIHEVAHAYDFNTARTAEEKALLRYCPKPGKSGAAGLQPDLDKCRRYYELANLVSTGRKFRHLLGWSDGIFSLQSRNKLLMRSPDDYEYSNPEESFAVNFEYFMLDPEFACRRPSVQHFYAKHFAYQPFPACEDNFEIPLHSNDQRGNLQRRISLDPARIYEVHYFFAGEGHEIMSKWGHAMFRLVICAPERKEVGPDCLHDLAYHVVLSYRANVFDFVLNKVKGLFGGYPSQLFITPLTQVIEEYTNEELREIRSVPIRFASPAEQADFVDRIREQYWAYLGPYYFLTNNCATEALNFLKATLARQSIQNVDILTPLGLYNELARRGIVDTSVLNDRDQAIKTGYYFASKQPSYEHAFKNISDLWGAQWPYVNVDDYVAESRADVRRASYVDYRQHHPKLSTPEARRLAANYYVLERLIATRLNKKVEREMWTWFENHPEFSAPEADEFLKLGSRLPSQYLREGGYGIPMRYEVPDRPMANAARSATIQIDLMNFAESKFPDDLHEMYATAGDAQNPKLVGNLKWFMNEVAKAH